MTARRPWWSRLFGRVPAAEPAPPTAASGPASQVPAFVAENAIERLLIQAATDPDARPAFNAAILDADLLAATPDAPAVAQTRIAGEGETLSILNVAGPDGRPVAALFTSEARLRAFGGDGYVAMAGRDLLGIVADGGALLNPGAAYGVHWTADDLAAILCRPRRRTLVSDTQVLLGTPADPPKRLLAELTPLLAAEPRVTAAWLALAHWPASDEAAWYLDLRADGESDDLAAGLGQVLRSELLDGKPIDIRVVGSDEAPGTGIRLKPAVLH